MSKGSSALVGALLLLAPAGASAQSSPIAVGAPASNILRAGTSVQLRTLTGLTTNGKKLKAGERFDLETTEPVSVNGQVVIPVGSHAVGEVSSVRNKGMWGKSGNIDARLVYLQVGDRQIRIRGAVSDKGVTGTAGVVGAAVFVPIAGFFLTGTSAQIPAGSPATAFIEEDVPVAFAGGTVGAAPLVVGTPAAAPVATVTPAAATIGSKPSKR